jgi:predicted  nucleic acid-binding Zn-ribbon protein
VNQHGPLNTTVSLNANQNQTNFLLELVKQAPGALDKLKPVIDAQNDIADLEHQIEDSKKTEETASADEARDRDNLTALKGNDAAKRFVDELNRAEDLLQSTRKQTADLEQKKQAAIDKLDALISSLSFDWDVEGK